MNSGNRIIQTCTLDEILAAQSLSTPILPPPDARALLNLITTVGPVTETFASSAVYLQHALSVPAGIKARLGRKTYEFPRLISDNLYEIPILSSTEEGVSIVLANDPREFAPNRIAVLAQAMPALGVFIRNGLEYLRATLRPTYDKMTGLPNRDSFSPEFQYAIRTVEEAALKGESDGLGLILFDIDNFKKYNDELGHQAGDLALGRMGSYLGKIVRESDVCHRFGGEEFVVGTVNSTKEKTVDVAERIRAYVETESRLDFERGEIPRPFTITAGVSHTADIDPGIASADIERALVKLADQRLYRAKHAQDGLSRNRVSWRYNPTLVNTPQ